jgi:ferredoxin
MPKLTYLPTGASFDVPAGTRYMDLCQKEDLPQPFGCTVGSCGTCCLTVEKGLEGCDPMSEDERDTVGMCTDHKNARLGCQLVIRGDLAVRPIE